MCNLRLPPVQSGKNRKKKLSWSFIQKIEYVLQTIVVALMVPIEIEGDWEKKRKLYQYVVCIICTNSAREMARIVCALFVCVFFFISLLWISCGNVVYIRVSNAAKYIFLLHLRCRNTFALDFPFLFRFLVCSVLWICSLCADFQICFVFTLQWHFTNQICNFKWFCRTIYSSKYTTRALRGMTKKKNEMGVSNSAPDSKSHLRFQCFLCAVTQRKVTIHSSISFSQLHRYRWDQKQHMSFCWHFLYSRFF